MLRLARGRDLPMAAGYAPDAGDAILKLGDRIRGIIGREPGPAAAIRGLVASGRAIEAIRVLREDQGLSLDEAKRRVDEPKSRGPGADGQPKARGR